MTRPDAAGPDAHPILRPTLTPLDPLRRDQHGAWLSPDGPARLRFGLDAAALAGAWVEIEVAILTDAETVRMSLYLERPGDGPPEPSPFAARARGRGRWVGLLPRDLSGLLFEPLDGPGRFRIEDATIRRLSRRELLGEAARIDPLETAVATFWRARGKKLRGRNRIEALFRRPTATTYAAWLLENETVSEAERRFMLDLMAEWRDPPLISVVMPVYNTPPRELEAAIRSVESQLYPRWELCIADDASPDPAVRPVLEAALARDTRIKVAWRPENGNIAAASNSALALATGAFVALLDHDDLLPPHALYYVAREIVAHPDSDIIYTDEDKVDESGARYDPHMKSDWNEEMLLAQNYLNHLSVFRTELVRRAGAFRLGLEGSQDHDLILRILDHTDETRIRHVPRVLYHWRNYKRSGAFSGRRLDEALRARRRALEDYVARRGIDGEVLEGPFGFNRLKRRLPDPAPKVTVVIPTRDAAKLVAVAARGVLEGTTYPDLELVIIDNESREPETRTLFDALRRDPRVKIRPYPGPFNFSAMNNRVVEESDAEFILLLNNDIEVIEPNWLGEMVALGLSDAVAAVGGRLLYPDNHVQHGGIVLGVGGLNGVDGVAGHSQLRAKRRHPGYFGRLVIPQYMSAVTGACMLVRREAFLAVGGFDEDKLAVAFNDVDLCLKLRAAGWKIAWTPYATLYHHESATRGVDTAPEKQERFNREVRVMLDRWGQTLRRDPYYNPNLSLVSAHFILKGLTPKVEKPPLHARLPFRVQTPLIRREGAWRWRKPWRPPPPP
ncbi:MAG: glycosyltransferase [Methylobacteriaceae bacterium]|nr:glycosyltransferase [Methylobacteriaceae bacterium]